MTKPYQTHAGAYPSIQINNLEHLPKDRLILALTRIRDRIQKGEPLDFYDDTTPGDKETSCSWGLCHASKKTWPDAQDHIFPVDFEQHGRLSPLSPENGLGCPLDTRPVPSRWGCFYACRVFQARKGRPGPTQEEALALYEAALAKLQT